MKIKKNNVVSILISCLFSTKIKEMVENIKTKRIKYE